MLDQKKLRDEPDYLREILGRRGVDNPWKGSGVGLDREGFNDLLVKHKETLAEIESLRTRRNRISEEFSGLKRGGRDTSVLTREIEELKTRMAAREAEFGVLERALNDALLRLPNALHPGVPDGTGPQDNIEARSWGQKPDLGRETRPHWEIGESLGILDFVSAGKMSGSRFAALIGAGAALERALISFMLDLHVGEHGYTEVFLPYLVSGKSMEGTGQLPKFEEEMLKAEKDDLYLIPTAEVSVTNQHRDDCMDLSILPRKYVSYSACFRREAGSYGKDTKGLIRNHQFNKVELVWFTLPERSFDDLEVLTNDAEDVLKRLEIPYRVMVLCGADIGFASAKTYDIEVWMPGEKKWREISSCSCFTDFQARRMNIKYKNQQNKREYVHTLNGSGVAVGRLLAAVLENYQKKNGDVSVPKVLQPYMKMETISR